MLLVLIGLAFIGFSAYKGVQYRVLANPITVTHGTTKSGFPEKNQNKTKTMTAAIRK